MDGIVTRRNIEEGENVVVGTMNNAGTVLLTIADMSVIEAEVEVDETDIPTVTLGQQARVTIDAVPDRTFRGRVTEIGNSPIQAADGPGRARGQQATNFKVVITLEEEVPDVRPGFTCTAEITTATRKRRRVGADPGADRARDAVRREGRRSCTSRRRRARAASSAGPRSSRRCRAPPEPPPGHERKETEGVFVFTRQPRRLHAGQGRHCRRALLRGRCPG